MKKDLGKMTRSLRYDLNEIPYDYIMEVMDQFKGLDPADRLPEELWTEVCNIVQEAVTKTIPKEEKYKKVKRLSEKALQIAEERRETKHKGERKRPTQLTAVFQRIGKRNQKAFLNEQCKEIGENNRMGKISDLLKKTGTIKGTFYAKMGTINNRNGKDLTEAEEIKKR